MRKIYSAPAFVRVQKLSAIAAATLPVTSGYVPLK